MKEMVLVAPYHWRSQRPDMDYAWPWLISSLCSKPSLTPLWEWSHYRVVGSPAMLYYSLPSIILFHSIMLFHHANNNDNGHRVRVSWNFSDLASVNVLYEVIQAQVEIVKKNLPQNSF